MSLPSLSCSSMITSGFPAGTVTSYLWECVLCRWVLISVIVWQTLRLPLCDKHTHTHWVCFLTSDTQGSPALSHTLRTRPFYFIFLRVHNRLSCISTQRRVQCEGWKTPAGREEEPGRRGKRKKMRSRWCVLDVERSEVTGVFWVGAAWTLLKERVPEPPIVGVPACMPAPPPPLLYLPELPLTRLFICVLASSVDFTELVYNRIKHTCTELALCLHSALDAFCSLYFGFPSSSYSCFSLPLVTTHWLIPPWSFLTYRSSPISLHKYNVIVAVRFPSANVIHCIICFVFSCWSNKYVFGTSFFLKLIVLNVF